MSAPLRLVYDASAMPPRVAGTRLSSVDELEPLLRVRLREGFDGELLLRGHDTARICVYEGRIPWVRASAYPEHLGDVLRRELGLPDAELHRAMACCRATGRRLGEGMLALGLLQPPELRDCLYRHISDQLWEILAWPGPVTVESNGWPHRYDHAFTFELDELLRRPSVPTPDELQRLAELVQRCRERLPGLALTCVVEAEEGTPLHGPPDEDAAARDLLGLCIVGVRRLVGHRITRPQGPPQGMVLTAPDACVVVQPVAWNPEWLLVLGGPEPPGRMLSVAQAVARDPEV
jgi:hypothetical protein